MTVNIGDFPHSRQQGLESDRFRPNCSPYRGIGYFIQRMILTLLLFSMPLMTVMGCKSKTTSSQASNTSSLSAPCECSDLACWRKATNDGVMKQLDCARTAMDAAFWAGGGWIVITANLFIVLADLRTALNDQQLMSALKLAPLAPGMAASIPEQKATASCVANASFFARRILTIVDNATKLKSDSARDITSFLADWFLQFNTLANLAQIVRDCLPKTAELTPATKVLMHNILDKWSKAMTIVTTLNSVVRCGFAFGEGSTLLFNNSVCAAEDYNRLQASAQQLQESHDRFASSAAPRSSAESCNGEPIHCSLWGMRKWGEFLRSESNSWLDSRSTFCSQHCGNGELAKSACTAAAAKVFGPDANACSSVCGVTQCQNAVNYCVSYCCREDESCIDKTHAKLK